MALLGRASAEEAGPLTPGPAPRLTPPLPAIEVRVQGKKSAGQKLVHSAESVIVVETQKVRHQSADLGEIMARTQGVTLRREGGLGSNARFSLNGLSDDQIRFFFDGVPLDLVGYPFGIANVPVNLVGRIEIYRGVVPVRFGADALGGAVNLVSPEGRPTRFDASYQVGSFGTHRVTLEGRYRHEPTGFILGATGFFDRASNDYQVEVQTPDAQGRQVTVTVPRFHDNYTAAGGMVEAGVVDKPWARRLTLQAYASSYAKDLQHNLVMTIPYGEATFGETVSGATVRSEVSPRKNWSVDTVVNYSHKITDFSDRSLWVYDWFGQRILPRRIGGEIDRFPSWETTWQDAIYARVNLEWMFAPLQIARLSLSPVLTSRTGDDLLRNHPSVRDPLSARRDLVTFVAGGEIESNFWGERLTNIAFVKGYVYRASGEEYGGIGNFFPKERNAASMGAGDALRLRLTSWLFLKASYEYATRLPRPDEVFGNGGVIRPNLTIEPEVSHNANLGPRFELRRSRIGDLTVDLNLFLRDSDNLIVLIGTEQFLTYQNIYRAQGIGVEQAWSWLSPRRRFGLDAALTYQDVRNRSGLGPFAAYEGDRIPNRPYLFASWAARMRLADWPKLGHTLEPFYYGRFVEAFFRGWESQGLRQFKQSVDTQVTHSLGLSWFLSQDVCRVSATFEVDNFTDAKVYDLFGVQRAGRAYYLKLTGEM